MSPLVQFDGPGGEDGYVAIVHHAIAVQIQSLVLGVALLELPGEGKGIENVHAAIAIKVFRREPIIAGRPGFGLLEELRDSGQQDKGGSRPGRPRHEPEPPRPRWPRSFQMRSGGSQYGLVGRGRDEELLPRQTLEGRHQPRRRFEGFVLVALVVVRVMHLQSLKCAEVAKGSACEESSGAFVVAQGLEGIMQTGFDRAERDGHCFSNFRQAETVHETEQQNLTLLVRQTGQDNAQVIRFCGGGRGSGGLLKLLQFGGGSLVTGGLAARRDREIAHRRVKEGLQIGREVEAGELPQQVEERLLQHVQRGIAVPGEPICKRGYPVAMTKVQDLEGGCVATVNGRDELQITARGFDVVVCSHPGVPAITLAMVPGFMPLLQVIKWAGREKGSREAHRDGTCRPQPNRPTSQKRLYCAWRTHKTGPMKLMLTARPSHNRSTFFTLAAFALLLSAAMPASVAAATVSPPKGFIALFNGQDLAGWRGGDTFDPRKLQAMPSDQREAQIEKWTASMRDHWGVENGELVNDGKGAYATTEKDYGDFELLLEYKTVARADSGIYLRGCPQVQIWDYTDQAKFPLGADKGSGGLWNNSPGAPGKDPLVRADKPFGEWNAVRVLMVGARVSVWLNDKLVVDHALLENYYDRKLPVPPKGPIQLQTHGGEIRWRKLFIREIGTTEANKLLAGRGNDGFLPVFNGLDFSGWVGPTENYQILDRAIQCRAHKGGTIYTAGEYADFVARLEFQLPPGGNNGLAIRYPGSGDTAYTGMCELQVLDDNYEVATGQKIDPRQAHGSAYGMVAAARGYQHPIGEWNFQEVTVKGPKIKVELNGTVILDCDLSTVTKFMGDHAHPGKDRTQGHFGFAGHNDPVAFRDILIKPL
jgi:hypothetical protein